LAGAEFIAGQLALIPCLFAWPDRFYRATIRACPTTTGDPPRPARCRACCWRPLPHGIPGVP